MFSNARRALKLIQRFTDTELGEPRILNTDSIPHPRTAVVAEVKRKSGILSDIDSVRLLSAYDIPTPPARVVSTVDESISMAHEIRYPVALKISSRDIPHVTDASAIKLNVKSDEEFKNAYDYVVSNSRAYDPNAKLEGVYVQKMVSKGAEVIIGVSKDELFGSFILFGIGGIFVEILRDSSIRLAPVSENETEKMVKEVKASRILYGFRGQPKTGVSSIAKAISRISMLAADLEDSILEMDINPLIVLPEGERSRGGGFSCQSQMR